MPPLTYGHFQVETDAAGLPVRLGPGGMGTTYRAFDTHLRRAVALKVIDDRRLADPTSRRRFFKEARTAAQLEHPNIARVLYLSPEDAKTCFFAMELVEGESLNERLSRLGPCAPHEALVLLRQVVDALACLGQNKLVHRDIKPDNIMLGTDPRERLRVKLIDFGLAKSIDSQPTILEADSEEHFIGSTYFASPEQVRSVGTLDHRSDFYSLGATLWHTLTGAPPFTGSTFEIQEAHVGREPPWEKVAHLPEPLRQLLRALLAKDPAARPADAAALARLWDGALADLAPRTPNPSANGRAAANPSAASSGSRLRWKRAEGVPYGCSEPPSSGFLAHDSDSGAWYFIRGLPPSLPASLRAELVAAATRAMEAGHAAVRRVLEVGDHHIISEWECSLSLAEFLAKRGKPLPLALVLAWLPGLAEAVHFASTHQLIGLSLQLSRVWLEFQQPEAAGSPLKTALLPPEQWGTHRVRLDPLGAFDPMLEALIGRGAAPEALGAATKVAADPLPHLAAAIYRLLGGQEPPPGMPLQPAPGVDAARNQLLVDAIEGRAAAATVPEWAALMLRASERRPPQERPAPPQTSKDADVSPPLPVKTAALAAGLCLLAAVIVFASKGGPKPSPASPSGTVVKVTPVPTASPVSQATAGGNTLWQNQSGSALILGTPPVFRIATPMPSPPALPPADYVNSLEMRFKKCKIVAAYDKTSVLASIWETRNRDYQAFVRATRRALPPAVKDFSTEASYPVIMVSWKDARDFCAWLTRKEIQEGRLKSTSRYRLPTDHEWSSFVGIAGMNDEHPGLPLAQKNCMILGIYGWGSKWPPPPGAGNLADMSAARLWTSLKPLANYDDGYAGTAPVGSFPPNSLGLFDLAGNVAEWCRDAADKEGTYIIRGSAFNTSGPMKLLASYRDIQPAAYRAQHVGFRVVLEQALP